jgi:5'-3' exonuclease
MGIPSFYRHLCRRFPKLISHGPGPRPEWLCLDFNCAMYYVLREYSAEHPYAAAKSKAHWETQLCEAIAAYMGELVALADPTKGVYVSCDGVVCAAKRKQQRLRRFKGPWMREAERSFCEAKPAVVAKPTDSTQVAKPTFVDEWDQNALTPGTAFMEELGRVLVSAGARLQARSGIQVSVSTTSEPGEGEHKILRFMREVRPTTCTIYGLDADLILLSMLLWADTGASVRLLREAQEFEKKNSKNEWRNLDILGLKDAMGSTRTPERIRDFVASMTLLGNDFLPRSLTKTVRNDGIPTLLQTLERSVWSRGLRIVADAGTLSREGLLALVDAWTATEETDMFVAVTDAREAGHRRRSYGSDKNPALQEWTDLPATWGSLTQILRTDGSALVPGWRDHYTRTWMAGEARHFCAGVAWTWDYYSGRTVEQGWHFESHLPPLWSAVTAYLRGSVEPVVPPPPVVNASSLPAWLHLLSVLPADSVRRLLPRERHELMEEAPHFWPSSWSLFDVGRTQMWECEPVIPVIPEEVLRRVMVYEGPA